MNDPAYLFGLILGGVIAIAASIWRRRRHR